MTSEKNMNSYYVGLMCGTSMDGIDAALCRFVDKDNTESMELLATHSEPLPNEVKQEAKRIQTSKINLFALAKLDVRIGALFATAAVAVIEKQDKIPKSDIRAIGSHGQTLIHSPKDRFSVQIGDANIIAVKTEVPVVSDFRRKDLALGGQGAPLAPAFHANFMASKSTNRVILNLGGIANVTILHADTEKHPVTAWDTGPGNCLLDAWIFSKLGRGLDKNGDWAKSGSVDKPLLKNFLDDPYFKLSGPKSTGTEYFRLQ